MLEGDDLERDYDIYNPRHPAPCALSTRLYQDGGVRAFAECQTWSDQTFE